MCETPEGLKMLSVPFFSSFDIASWDTYETTYETLQLSREYQVVTFYSFRSYNQSEFPSGKLRQ